MNVAVLKTKAEQALVERFETAKAALPGGAWVHELRNRAIGSFAALGLPHKRIEEWKYTDVRERLRDVPPLAVAATVSVDRRALEAGLGRLAGLTAYRIVFVDGKFAAHISDVASLPANVTLRTLADGLVQELPHPSDMLQRGLGGATDTIGNIGEAAIDALNLAYMSDGAILEIGAGAVDRPILLVFAHSSHSAGHVATRNIFRSAPGAEATVIEAYVVLDGAGSQLLDTTVTDVEVGEGARLTHVQSCAARTALETTHLASWRVRLERNATYRSFHLTSDVALARNDLNVTFSGPGSKVDLSGCFLGRGREHIDSTLVVDHAVPGCESRELYKGVLDGRARGVFQGKVIVRPDAQKTDGKQMAQALMLSEDAEFDSKPELEIHADDVVCGHGTTAAELDPELLFYLRSRGLPLDEARALLIESFIGEAFDRIEDDPVRQALSAMALDWLHRKLPTTIEHAVADAQVDAAN